MKTIMINVYVTQVLISKETVLTFGNSLFQFERDTLLNCTLKGWLISSWAVSYLVLGTSVWRLARRLCHCYEAEMALLRCSYVE